MKKQDELLRDLTEMLKETRRGKLSWKVACQTTEYNDAADKPVVEEDGMKWMVDECYVSFLCQFRGKDFLMITYEMIHSAGEKQKTTNLIFLPPMGIRYFDIHALLPYAVEANQMLTYQVHSLWETLLDLKKSNSDQVVLDVSERRLEIEEDRI